MTTVELQPTPTYVIVFALKAFRFRQIAIGAYGQQNRYAMRARGNGGDLVCIFVVGGFSRHTISDVNIFRIDIARYHRFCPLSTSVQFSPISAWPRINVKKPVSSLR